MNRLADLALRFRLRLLLVIVLLTVVAAVLGSGVRDRLSVGGFVDPNAESTLVDEALVEEFGAGPPNHFFVLSLADGEGRLDHERYEEPGLELTAAIANETGVADVVSFWSLGRIPYPAKSPLIDLPGEHVLISMRLLGTDNEQRATADRLSSYVGEWGPFEIAAGGVVETSRQAAEIAERDLTRSELAALPFTLVALFIVFRGWRAGLMPLAVAAVAVLGSFAVLSLIATLIEVSIFAVNLTTALGLGLAIDYSLLVVSRYREELAAGRPVDRALRRTLRTAGHTVVFSAATTIASLSALLVFPFVYLRSFAYAGCIVVSIAAATALVVLPCLLAWLGTRIGVPPAARSVGAERRFWGRQARRVQRHPLVWAVGASAVLVALALPFLSVEPGRLDDRSLPPDAEGRQAVELIREHFSWAEANPISVYPVAASPDDKEARDAYRERFIEELGIARIDTIDGFHTEWDWVAPLEYSERFVSDEHMWISVASYREPDEPEHEAVVRMLRDDPGPFESVEVGGAVAQRIDTIDSVVARLPLAFAIIAAITMISLFMLTGSVVISIKAVLLNMASLGATFGALVWVFQQGNLSGVLGFTPTGTIDIFTPLLLFCIAFGLSMDYEVFVLARIKEEYDLGGSNDEAIVAGVARTGPLVTAAAVIMTIVFVAIGMSGVTVAKMIGLGVALAVLVDAFIVRATLTPALMTLMGHWNWWSPRALRHFHLRWGVWENEPVDLEHLHEDDGEHDPDHDATDRPSPEREDEVV